MPVTKRKPLEKDIRKMNPRRLTSFALRVLRATSPKKMVQGQYFQDRGKLRDKILALEDSYGPTFTAKKMALRFKHKKDCLGCAVGCVLLADGLKAAIAFNAGWGTTYKPFTQHFLSGLSEAFENNGGPASGRREAIKYVLRVQADLTPKTTLRDMPFGY